MDSASDDRFHPGDRVHYRTFIDGEVLYHGTVLAGSHMHQDYDGDGPRTEPYKVYPIEVAGGRGVGGYWSEDAMGEGHPQLGTKIPRGEKP